LERLLAFIDVFADPSKVREISGNLARLPNVEELYETGDSLFSVVSEANVEEIRKFLNGKVRNIPGVRCGLTYFVLDARRDVRKGSRRPSSQ